MQNKLREYADILIKIGLNLQDGQILNIRSQVENADFTRLCVEAAYKAGASNVIVHWRDDFCDRQKYLYADSKVFESFPDWTKDEYNYFAENKAAVLSIFATDPELYHGVDSSRISSYSKARGNALKSFYAAQMANLFQWCVCSAPILSWAKKVYPDDADDIAMQKLWDSIFKTLRITGDGKAAQRWQEHFENIGATAKKLNDFNFKSLHYKNSIGTDLIAELPENHLWLGGCEYTSDGIRFAANMPTEEIFTAPIKTGVNGTVVSSMPLCHDGNIIENFKFTLKNGKIVDVTAEKGEDVLKMAISEDEGSSYFGELALVPFNSPISNMNLLFYNTLFDENASCHIAFGEAYPCIKNGNDISRDELDKLGLNNSITHVDFMIGTSDMSITGLTHDGKEIPVMRDGNFVI